MFVANFAVAAAVLAMDNEFFLALHTEN